MTRTAAPRRRRYRLLCLGGRSPAGSPFATEGWGCSWRQRRWEGGCSGPRSGAGGNRGIGALSRRLEAVHDAPTHVGGAARRLRASQPNQPADHLGRVQPSVTEVGAGARPVSGKQAAGATAAMAVGESGGSGTRGSATRSCPRIPGCRGRASGAALVEQSARGAAARQCLRNHEARDE